MQETDEYTRRHRWFQKKRPRELRAVLSNLNRYFDALDHGAKPKQIQGGWIHPEPMDVVAVDQKGGGKGLRETRLYLYPDVASNILHVIILGDKTTQKREDIAFCKECVQRLQATAKGQQNDPQTCKD